MILRQSLVLAALACPAFAETLATGPEIAAAISGNTIDGTATGQGPYVEYYGKDGTIRGYDYSGRWSIQGDLLCVSEVTKLCMAVRINGDLLTWVNDGEGGEDGATMQILPGNPYGF
ncbi:MAG: hypothetical protein EAZ40_01455 [Rhodobacterales bacterium]|nr:MAG: hypothetical protein EAZ40_01455 [Rhodobacterales bacterium]